MGHVLDWDAQIWDSALNRAECRDCPIIGHVQWTCIDMRQGDTWICLIMLGYKHGMPPAYKEGQSGGIEIKQISRSLNHGTQLAMELIVL